MHTSSPTKTAAIPHQTALHQGHYSLQPRIVISPYAPASRLQREHYWLQRLGSLFARQRY